MRRHFIVVGDKTTSGGIVTEGEPGAMNRGRWLSYHGARIDCPACESEGRIVGVGPTRPHTYRGKQAALENDLCICKCEPPPVLIASLHNAWMSFESHELAEIGNANDGSDILQRARGAFDRQFRFVDGDGRPVAGIRVYLTDVDGQTKAVVTDRHGRTPLKSGAARQRIGVALREAARK